MVLGRRCALRRAWKPRWLCRRHMQPFPTVSLLLAGAPRELDIDAELKAALLPLLQHTRARLLAHGGGAWAAGGAGSRGPAAAAPLVRPAPEGAGLQLPCRCAA